MRRMSTALYCRRRGRRRTRSRVQAVHCNKVQEVRSDLFCSALRSTSGRVRSRGRRTASRSSQRCGASGYLLVSFTPLLPTPPLCSALLSGPVPSGPLTLQYTGSVQYSTVQNTSCFAASIRFDSIGAVRVQVEGHEEAADPAAHLERLPRDLLQEDLEEGASVLLLLRHAIHAF